MQQFQKSGGLSVREIIRRAIVSTRGVTSGRCGGGWGEGLRYGLPVFTLTR